MAEPSTTEAPQKLESDGCDTDIIICVEAGSGMQDGALLEAVMTNYRL